MSSELLELANAARAEWLKATADGSTVQLALGVPETRLAKPARPRQSKLSRAATALAGVAASAAPVIAALFQEEAPSTPPTPQPAKTRDEPKPKLSRLALALQAPIAPYTPLENQRCWRAIRECIPPGGGHRRFVIRTANNDRTVHTYMAFRGDPPEVWRGILAIAFIHETCPECQSGDVVGDTVVARFAVEE